MFFDKKIANDWIRTAGQMIGSDHSTNWATTTALFLPVIYITQAILVNVNKNKVIHFTNVINMEFN